MPKVSIVIPVYNVEEYLKECLDSIANQTLQDIEVICVNDGSTDRSPQILDDYAKLEKRIKVFHCENKGAGEARNFGLEQIKGDFVLFFDSDDYMKKNTLEKMYNNAIDSNADLVICKSQGLEQDTGEISELKHSVRVELLENKTLFSPQEISESIFQFCVGWPWDKLYRTSFVKKNKLLFQNLRHSNDTFFVLYSLTLANLISIETDILITHRCHNKSLAATRVEKPECFYNALKKLFCELKRTKTYSIYEQSFINYCLIFSAWHIESVKDDISKRIMLKYFKKLAQEIKLEKYEDSFFYHLYTKQKLCSEAFDNKFLQKIYRIKYDIFKNKKDLVKSYGNDVFAQLHILLKESTTTVVFWGASLFLEDFLHKSKIKNKNILGIVDKNAMRQGKKIKKYKIFPPEKLQDLKPDRVILTIKNNNEIIYEDVKKYLIENFPSTTLCENIFEKRTKQDIL